MILFLALNKGKFRTFCTNQVTKVPRTRSVYFPITLSANFEQINKKIRRKVVFDLFKKIDLPVKGVRNNGNLFLVDLLFINNLPGKDSFIKTIKWENNEIPIDLSYATKVTLI